MKKLVRIVEEILVSIMDTDEPRADMFLPIWILAFGIVLIIGGITLAIMVNPFIGIGIVFVGVMAILCWKNQTIHILSETEFEYKTFLGNKVIYRFDEIRELRKNKDSMTLYVGNGKVHIESSAIITEELALLINASLERHN